MEIASFIATTRPKGKINYLYNMHILTFLLKMVYGIYFMYVIIVSLGIKDQMATCIINLIN